MKKIISSVVFILINITVTLAGNTTPLKDAISKNMVQCFITGNDSSPHYIRPLLVDIMNTQDIPVDISIENGRKFLASDSTYQNLVVVKSELISLKPKERKQLQVYSMCIQANNHAPVSKVIYRTGEMADEKLCALTNFIEKHKYFNTIGQDAVWVLTNNYDVGDISSRDTNVANNLMREVIRLTGKKPGVPNLNDKVYAYRHYRVDSISQSEIEGEFIMKLNQTSSVQIAMFDKNNIVVRELLFNPSVSAGKHTFVYKYDASVYKDHFYYFKMIVDGDIKVSKKIDAP